MAQVTVLSLKDGDKFVTLDGAKTVRAALKASGYDVENDTLDIRLNGVRAGLTSIVKTGDIVYIAPKVEGGR